MARNKFDFLPWFYSYVFLYFSLLLMHSEDFLQTFLAEIQVDNSIYIMADFYNEFLFVDNLPYKTTRPFYPGWRKAWKPKSCHHFHAWRRLTNDRYESGMLFFDNSYLIFFILRPDMIIQLRTTTWKKLLKWETCFKNFLKGMIWDTHQFSAWGNISSLEGVPLCHN